MMSPASNPHDHLPLGAETMSPAMARAKNYYGWIASQFQLILGERILDVGGGHGAHLDHIVTPNRFVVSVDLSPDCICEMEQRFAGLPFAAKCGDITESTLLAHLTAQHFDTITCLNVLEHIEDDAAAVQAMASILLPAQGRLFLLVPAHPILFGTPDVLAGHFRRYRRWELERMLVAAGFHDVRGRYFNWFGVIPYFLNSRILRPRTLSGPVDTQIVLFDRYFVPLLRRLDPFLRLPFGQSLIVTGRA